MSEDSEIKTYDDGVKDGEQECKNKFAKKQSLDLFAEGYKMVLLMVIKQQEKKSRQ